MCTGLWRELDLHFKTGHGATRLYLGLRLKILKSYHVRSTFGRWGRQNVHQTVESSISHENSETNEGAQTNAGILWSSLHCQRCAGHWSIWYDAPALICFAGLQPAVVNHIGTALRSKAWVMLRRSWQVGLQLEVAKRVVTASRRVVLGHGATFLLCGIATGGCWMHWDD